jgi:hypothetical protein
MKHVMEGIGGCVTLTETELWTFQSLWGKGGFGFVTITSTKGR